MWQIKILSTRKHAHQNPYNGLYITTFLFHKLKKVYGIVAQSVVHLSEKQEVPGTIYGPAIYFRGNKSRNLV